MATDQRNAIRIIITEPQPGASADLQRRLSQHFEGAQSGAVNVLAVAHDGLEAAQMAVQLRPDVILLDEEMPGMSGYEAAEMIALAAPDVASALMVSRPRADDERVVSRALLAGARAVLAPDLATDQIVEVLTSLADLPLARGREEYELITDPAKMPVTIAVTGAKGGIGKSLLTANLAVSFARKHPDQVVLVDFYGQFGNTTLMLDLRTNYSIADLAAFAGEMDASILNTHLVRHEESTLRVLAGHAGCAGLDGCLTPEAEILFLADLIGLLRRHYRFVFFDVPPLIGPASDYVFSRSQYILLVGALTDIAAVRDTAALYRQLVEERIAPERIWLVCNRVVRQSDLTVQDLEQAAGAKVRFEIPEDATTAVASINEGSPAVLSRPGTVLGRAVRELADRLEGAMAEEQRRRAAPAAGA